MMLPSVTGTRFATMKSAQVRLASSSEARPLASTAASSSLSSKPIGMKYMLAMLCSKPAATKAVIGKTIATALPAALLAARLSQTARVTRTLQRIPRATAWTKPYESFVLAMRRAAPPTSLFPRSQLPATKTSSAVATAPTKLPA